MTSSPKTVAPLADVEVAESEDDLLEEGRLSPMEKRRKRSKDDLDRIVGEALKPMYGGQFQERSLTDEETESRKLLFPENDDDFAFDPSMLPDDKLLTKSKEDGNPKILKPVERYHLYQAARPVQEALRLRTAGLTAASVRCKALQLTPTRPAGRPSSAPHQLASSGGTAKTKKTATSVAHPPYSAQPPRPIVDEKSSKGDVDGRCQELAPEKQKLLNDLLLPGQVFRGGPILIPEIARQQQEATEQRMQREAKLREERMKAMIAAAPQRAKERQKKLQQWKAAFRKANAPVDEVENDVLPC
jgi:hypothetical protein